MEVAQVQSLHTQKWDLLDYPFDEQHLKYFGNIFGCGELTERKKYSKINLEQSSPQGVVSSL